MTTSGEHYDNMSCVIRNFKDDASPQRTDRNVTPEARCKAQDRLS